MESKLTIRSLIKEDYDTICKWWKWWRWKEVARESLPDNGTSGFMVQYNEIMFVLDFYTQQIVTCVI